MVIDQVGGGRARSPPAAVGVHRAGAQPGRQPAASDAQDEVLAGLQVPPEPFRDELVGLESREFGESSTQELSDRADLHSTAPSAVLVAGDNAVDEAEL